MCWTRSGGGTVTSAPEHRRGAGSHVDPRLLLVAAFVVGALVSGAVVAVLADGSGGSSGDERPAATDTGSPRPSPSPRAGKEPSAPPSSAAPARGDPLTWALGTQPLVQLRRGDRVVYDMNPCRFRSWVGGDTDVAVIACPGEDPFQTETENLVPVEPARGD